MGGIIGGGNTTISNTEPAALGIQIQTSAYGMVLPIKYGRSRIPGNLIWYGNFQAIPHTTSQSSGGKGGGGVTTNNTTYTYTAGLALGLCEGQISSINGAWADKKYIENAVNSITQYATTQFTESVTVPGGAGAFASKSVSVSKAASWLSNVSVAIPAAGYTNQIGVYNQGGGIVPQANNSIFGSSSNQSLILGTDYTVNKGVYTFAPYLAGARVTITYNYSAPYTVTAPFNGFIGTYPQSPWSYLTTNYPDAALGYEGVAYVSASAYDLGGSASLPNHTFDVTGRLPYLVGQIDDANPKDIIYDFLTNSHYGAGLPVSKLGNWTQYANYCISTGLFLSPTYSEQTQASDTITALVEMTNSGIYFSEGLLKITPYGDVSVTANGVTYTPNTTPVYALADDDFIVSGQEDPVRLLRNSSADAYNQVQVEFLNRFNQYNVETAEAKDQVSIDSVGVRTKSPVTAHEICDPGIARAIAQLMLQRSLGIRNTYEFKLSWRYCLLEPTDYVTITDATLGLTNYPVRILSVEEDDTGLLSLTAEDAPAGVSSHALYGSQSGNSFSNNINVSAGNTNVPVIFEAPDLLTVSGLEVWIGASGGSNWGGCQVWVSFDGTNYQQVGKITNPARQGVLKTNLASVADPDTTSTLSVDMSMSAGILNSGTKADADSFNTLCYVDGELISFQTATLTAANIYNLTYLRRGAYSTTVGAHNAASQFLRFDDAIFKFPFTNDRIGSTFYIKLPSYNVFGGGAQALGDVSPYTYKVTGSALTSPLPNVKNLTTNFVSGLLTIYWDSIVDFRQPNVDYEVRFGASWATGKVIGRTSLTKITATSNGTYWVAAHYQAAGGLNAYSGIPQSITVSGATLVRNVIATYDEYPAWSGTLSGGLALNSLNELMLYGTTDVLGSPDWLSIADFLFGGGIALTGTYTLPSSHTVNIGRVAPCVISMNYTARGQSIFDNFLTLNDLLSIQDLLGAALGSVINVQPQIAIADGTGVFGAWQNFVPGSYNAQYFKAQAVVTTSDNQVTAVVTDLVFTVDVPDRIDPYQITTSASASTSVTYTTPFNGGVGGGLPLVQATILSANANDDVIISGQTLSGCLVDVFNGGSRVIRNVNIQVQGY